MTDERPPAHPPARTKTGDALMDGVPAGVIAAITITVWLLILDLAAGGAFATPALVGTLLLEGPSAVFRGVVGSPSVVTTGLALILLESIVIGGLVSRLTTLPRRAVGGGVVFLVAASCLLLAFFALDGAAGAGLFARLGPWAVLGGNALAAAAMTVTLRVRQPRLVEGRRDLRDDEP